MTPPPEREVSNKLSAMAPTYAQNLLRVPGKPDAYITAFCIQDANGLAPGSASFQNREPGNNPQPGASHFNFLPGVDDVEMRWTVVNPKKIVRAKFEVWAAGVPGAAIWTKEYAGLEAATLMAGQNADGRGNLAWAEVVIAGDELKYPDQIPNVANAPYQVRLTVQSENGMITSGWTYFDVLVHTIRLRWGGRPLRPPGHIADVLPIYQPLTHRDEGNLLNELDRLGDIDPLAPLDIELPSTNAAYIHLQEWYMWRDMAFERYQARWGKGPRIPILAKTSLKRMNGDEMNTVAARRCLGPAKFLWDWKDKTEVQRLADLATAHATARAFVISGLKYKENLATEPPNCLNAHFERGGKRGGPDRVLPEFNDAGQFPFPVAAAGTRVWASVSTAATAGPYKGETGVIFQPCRMAHDTYQLRVFLATGGHLATLDVAGSMQTLENNHANLPTAATAMMTVVRRINAQYLRKSADTPRMDLAEITEAYGFGGAKIHWTEPFWTQAEYTQLMNEAKAPDNAAESLVLERGKLYQKNARGRRLGLTNWTTRTQTIAEVPSVVKAQLGNYDQWFGCPAGTVKPHPSLAQFTLPGRDLVEGMFIAPATEAFINRRRMINKWKKRWTTFQNQNVGVQKDALLVRYFNEVLGDSERSDLLPVIQQNFEEAGWKGWDLPRDRPAEWVAANYSYRLAKLVYLSDEMHARKVIADRFEGVTIFHYQHLYDILNPDDSIYGRQCAIGGVAAISMVSDLGLSGGFTVWDHPDNMQRQILARDMCEYIGTVAEGGDGHTGPNHPECTWKDGTNTMVHEFGHFLHLPHARPTGGAQEANMHDQNDAKCIMNYDPDALHLCGACLLRLRGWAFFKLKTMEGFSNTTPNQAGAAPPPPTDIRIDNELAGFYTDWA